MSDQSQLRRSLEGLRDQPEQLIEIILRQAGVIEEQREQIRKLEEQIRDLNDRNGKLQQRLEDLERVVHRPAAPFRIDDKKRLATPRRPGRPKGHAPARRPIPDHIDEYIVVPLPSCPQCQSPLARTDPVVQYIEELPPVRPRVIQLTTHRGQCRQCQCEVRSTHPLQVSLAQGAAAVQLGPQALAVACELNKRHGLTLRRTAQVLKSLFGLSVSAGGLVQAMHRLAGRLSARYEAMIERMRAGPLVHSDETSWWVGQPGWWLWVFADARQTLYHVARGRGREVLTRVLGTDYGGVLVSDCLSIYDGVNPLQQKCYAHHLKAIREAAEQNPTPYLEAVRGLLVAAMALKETPLPAEKWARHRAALERSAQELLTTPRGQGLEERVRLRLWKQRDHLFTFLDHAGVSATNNLAERQLRPAVIARKLSCGNKTPAGARTWEVLASLAATCVQRGESFAHLIATTCVLPQR